MIFESSGTAVEAGAPVVITGCADVTFTEGEIGLLRSIQNIYYYQIMQV